MRVCRVHGGASPRGTASPHFKTGRFSRHLPTHVRERYEEALADPDLLASHSEIALFDVRLSELVGRLNTEDNRARWSTARWAIRALREAWDTPLHKYERDDDTQEHEAADGWDVLDPGERKEQRVAAALAQVEAAIYAGSDDEVLWTEITELGERRSKVAERESRRQMQLGQMVTAEQVMLLVSQLALAVRTHVTDQAARTAINTEIIRLIGTPANAGD